MTTPVVLLTGGPGAGKSTVGRALATTLGAALVDQDTVTGALVAVIADLVGVHDLDDPRLAGPTRAARYEAVVAVAEDNLRVGTPVTLVAPFTRERADIDAWVALDRRLRNAGGAPLLVWLRLRPETALRRLKARSAARDLAKTGNATGLDVAAPSVPHLAVDAERPVAELVDTVLAALAESAAQ
jgi:predicted kinase